MLEQFNMALFMLISHYIGVNPFLDELTIIVAKYMPIPFVIAIIYYFYKGAKCRDIALFSIYVTVFGLAISLVIWNFYFHPRPFMVPIGTQLFPFPPDTSFPSDYTTFMVTIALMMIYFKETRKIGVLFIILGIIGGFARSFVEFIFHWTFWRNNKCNFSYSVNILLQKSLLLF